MTKDKPTAGQRLIKAAKEVHDKLKCRKPLIVMTDLKLIIARLESAETGNRRLDGEILAVIGAEWDEGSMSYQIGGSRFAYVCTGFTTSLDAIAALTAELLPDAHVATEGQWGAWVCAVTINGDCFMSDDECRTEPLARCSALLRAMERK